MHNAIKRPCSFYSAQKS